jgi:hypothetical protein
VAAEYEVIATANYEGTLTDVVTINVQLGG